jgi:hypothetical protein
MRRFALGLKGPSTSAWNSVPKELGEVLVIDHVEKPLN